jgi:hypothetical protein
MGFCDHQDALFYFYWCMLYAPYGNWPSTYRVDSFQAREPLTNLNSVVSKIWELSYGVCHEKA